MFPSVYENVSTRQRELSVKEHFRRGHVFFAPQLATIRLATSRTALTLRVPVQDDPIMRLQGQDNQTFPEPSVGDRLVFYEYCISLIVVSLRRPSAVVRLRPGQRGWIRGLPYTIVSLLFGWWCIP